MSLLSEYRAEELGVTFHRDKTIDALLRSIAGGNALIDLLFSITRAPKKKPVPQVAPVPAYKGIVHFQTGVGRSVAAGLRELHQPDEKKGM